MKDGYTSYSLVANISCSFQGVLDPFDPSCLGAFPFLGSLGLDIYFSKRKIIMKNIGANLEIGRNGRSRMINFLKETFGKRGHSS